VGRSSKLRKAVFKCYWRMFREECRGDTAASFGIAVHHSRFYVGTSGIE
jgi:hypothetical protein